MTVYLCSLTRKTMVLYTIKLSKYEVEGLDKIISKGRHTSQAFRAAYILLSCDKLVMDNFKTHDASEFYETFLPEEAKRLWNEFEFIFTPHGNWLNMAEIELHVLNAQCLNRHIPAISEITSEVKAWKNHRNNKTAKIK